MGCVKISADLPPLRTGWSDEIEGDAGPTVPRDGRDGLHLDEGTADRPSELVPRGDGLEPDALVELVEGDRIAVDERVVDRVDRLVDPALVGGEIPSGECVLPEDIPVPDEQGPGRLLPGRDGVLRGEGAHLVPGLLGERLDGPLEPLVRGLHKAEGGHKRRLSDQ